MKKGLIIFAGMMAFGLLFAGFSTSDARAVSITTPQESCQFALNTPGFTFLPGSHYNAANEQCILGWTYEKDGYTNYCYPQLDIYQVVWGEMPIVGDKNGLPTTSWYWEFVGCAGSGHFIKDPNQGSANLGNGYEFNYERETCANGCNVTKFGITAPAKRALGSLSGTVVNKTYVQIRDDDGMPVSGEFSLCFYAKGAENPHFFRWAGGDNWTHMGGFWKGDNFCMGGNYSGNYVLVEMP
ncbi:MAG: hypothetical protein JW757_01835 [Anaerolineales bacterium]|nr:hypothetical protein [Anaerolineales bacterium]